MVAGRERSLTIEGLAEVEPVSVELLLAVAGGMGGAVGSQVWNSLSALVRRPLHSARTRRELEGAGVGELVALQAAPHDEQAATRLVEVLAARAGEDAEFGRALQDWRLQAEREYPRSSGVVNTITGGTFHAPVIQTQTATGMTFNPPPQAPAADKG